MSPSSSMGPEERYLLVAYDIANDKRRTRLARFLEARLVRRQESLFEGWIPRNQLKDFTGMIRDRIDGTEDTVRIFDLPPSVRDKVILLGRPLPLIPQRESVIL